MMDARPLGTFPEGGVSTLPRSYFFMVEIMYLFEGRALVSSELMVPRSLAPGVEL